MHLQHRREASARPRFLLALTLSTVTALGVAAPLAIKANQNSHSPTYSSALPSPGDSSQTSNLNARNGQRTLSGQTTLSQGGIGAQARAKGQATTPKSGSNAGHHRRHAPPARRPRCRRYRAAHHRRQLHHRVHGGHLQLDSGHRVDHEHHRGSSTTTAAPTTTTTKPSTTTTKPTTTTTATTASTTQPPHGRPSSSQHG